VLQGVGGEGVMKEASLQIMSGSIADHHTEQTEHVLGLHLTLNLRVTPTEFSACLNSTCAKIKVHTPVFRGPYSFKDRTPGSSQ
jgi:hypothetical protein